MAYSEDLQGDWKVIEQNCSGDENLWGGYQRVMRRDGFKCWRTILRYNRMTECEIQQMKSEFQVLASIRHPNIIDHYTWAHDRQDRVIYMMRENDSFDTLENYVTKCRNHKVSIPEKVIWEVVVPILEGLFACHYLRPTPSANSWNASGPGFCPILPVVPTSHGDVRPANVHWEPGKPLKLTRFRMHAVLALTTANRGRGFGTTQAYTAPEVLGGSRHSPASDVWSLGCILSELCTLNPIFSKRQTQWDVVQGVQGGLAWMDTIECSILLKEVIKACLQLDPSQRPTTAQILGNQEVLAIRKGLMQSNGRMEVEAQNSHLQSLLEKRRIENVTFEKVHNDEVALLKAELEKKEREIQRLKADKKRMQDELPSKISEAIAGMDLQRLVVNGLQKNLDDVFRTGAPGGSNGGTQSGGAVGMRGRYATDVEMEGGRETAGKKDRATDAETVDCDKTFVITTGDGGGALKGTLKEKGKAIEAEKNDGSEASKGKGKAAEVQNKDAGEASGTKGKAAGSSQLAVEKLKGTATTQSSTTDQLEQEEESDAEPDEFEEEAEEEVEEEEEEEVEEEVGEGADSDPDA